MYFSKHDGAHEIVHNRKFVPGNRFSGQNQNLAPNSSQLLDPRANHGHATGPNRPRPIGIAWPRPIDLSDRLEPSNPNQDARSRPRQSAQPVPKTPNQATQPNARPDRSLRSPDPLVRVAYRTRPLGPTLPSRIFRPGHAAWTESPSLAESNRLPGRAEPPSLHQNPAQIV